MIKICQDNNTENDLSYLSIGAQENLVLSSMILSA